MADLKRFLQKTGRDLLQPSGPVQVIVEMSVGRVDEGVLKPLRDMGLAISEIVHNKIIGAIAAERLNDLRQAPQVRDVELSVPLKHH